LPVVVLLAWVFDITPDGVRRTVAGTEPPPPGIEQQIEAHRRRFAAKAVGFVGVGILVALVGFAAYGRYAGFSGGASKRIESVAVMPFADFSPNRDQEYFTDGVTEELINRLTHIEGLRVAGRTSSFAFKGKEVPADQIGRQLRVQAVIDGSVRREGENVRVTVELVDAQTSHVIWSEKYDRQVSGVFALQDEIATAIVDALKLQLAPSAPELAKGERGTRNSLAHDLYLKGLDAWNKHRMRSCVSRWNTSSARRKRIRATRSPTPVSQ
jgi:TolB-like protein